MAHTVRCSVLLSRSRSLGWTNGSSVYPKRIYTSGGHGAEDKGNKINWKKRELTSALRYDSGRMKESASGGGGTWQTQHGGPPLETTRRERDGENEAVWPLLSVISWRKWPLQPLPFPLLMLILNEWQPGWGTWEHIINQLLIRFKSCNANEHLQGKGRGCGRFSHCFVEEK